MESNQDYEYEYDSLNRLKDATETISSNQTWKQTFTYDCYGNRNFDERETITLEKKYFEKFYSSILDL